jgi:regulatory protein
VKITNLSTQQRDPNRINVFVDDKYRFSLDVSQVVSLGVKIGREYDEQELAELEQESQFGKLYGRALEYCLMRPHSAREVRDYLWRKTRATRYRSKKTGELKERPGVSQALVDRVYKRLVEKAYIDDEKFTRYWVENRNQTKGMSRRKLEAELRAKGVANDIIERNLRDSLRNDTDELQKIIAKKRRRYPDEQKFMQYLARQGFAYDDIKNALSAEDADYDS